MTAARPRLPSFAVRFLLACSCLHAQSTAGRFSGTVTDPSGAAVPDVSVSAVNTETGRKVAEKTNRQGQFVLYPLPPGAYDITVQSTGFTAGAPIRALELGEYKYVNYGCTPTGASVDRSSTASPPNGGITRG